MNRLFCWFMVLGTFTFAVVSNVRAAGANPNVISFTMRLGNQNFNTTSATGKFLVVSGTPSYEAVVVRYAPSGEFVPLSAENIKNAVWTPYDGIIRMNFGPTDGVYDNLGQPIIATTNSISATDSIDHDAHRFYRVFLLP